MDSKGYYSTLGVSEKATNEEIKTAYRKLSIKYHPDKQSGKSDAEKKAAEETFKKVNEAYQVLSDENKRKEYDNPYSGMGGSNMGGAPFSGYDFGGFDFNDIFGNVFGGGYKRQQQNANWKPQHKVEKGKTLQLNVFLTLEEIYNGCSKKFKFKKNVRCANCHGSGGLGVKKVCPVCGGTGSIHTQMQTMFGIMASTETCKNCNGEGYVHDKKCPTCHGTGFTEKEITIEVNFEPGVKRGTVLTKIGDGHESKDPKGPNGDCMIVVDYRYDFEKYNIQGLDVMEKIDIPYYDALLGCEYTVDMPNGTKKKVNIASCTPNGKLLKMTGEGIKSGNNKGNYYLSINYIFPSELDIEERKKLEDIKVMYYKKEHNLEIETD